MDVRWAERPTGTPVQVDDREAPEQSGAASKRPPFRRLLNEANERLRGVVDAPGGVAPHGQQTLHIVRAGDTLSHLVQAAMRQSGQRVSRGELYRAIDIVAGANRLTDPDRIRPGQAIDLSAVVPGVRLSKRAVELSHGGGAGSGVGEPAVGMLHGLKSFMQSFAGRFTSAFGPRTDPMTGLRAFHAGVDIKMPAGSLIYPAAPGRVIFSGRTLGYGNLIVLAHAGGFTTAYGHNASNLIPTGLVVDRETPIAVVGATGKATGTHLHFEVRKDGHPIDPDLKDLGDQGGQQDL